MLSSNFLGVLVCCSEDTIVNDRGDGHFVAKGFW